MTSTLHQSHPSIAKFQQFVELKDFRPPTKKEYVRYVRKLAEHFGCDPLALTEDQLRRYFLFLRQEKHYTRSPMKAAKFSLRSFFVDCHQRTGWTVFNEEASLTAPHGLIFRPERSAQRLRDAVARRSAGKRESSSRDAVEVRGPFWHFVAATKKKASAMWRRLCCFADSSTSDS